MSADPRGYYRALGVSPTAKSQSIKRAYRRRAKALHPDHNPSPQAAEAFHRLSEAYRIVGDSRRRAHYDQSAASGKSYYNAKNGVGRSEPQAAAAKKKSHIHRSKSRQARRRSRPRNAKAATAQLYGCSRCGTVTAQPRYVRFPIVKGVVFKTVRSNIQGIYCRRCADLTALGAAARCWLGGWWSLGGPPATIRALWINLKGGELPPDLNFRLLLHQANAFLARGSGDIAHGLARHATMFARSKDEVWRANVIIQHTARGSFKNKWTEVGSLRLAQFIPIFALVIVAFMVTPSSQMPTPVRALLPDTTKISHQSTALTTRTGTHKKTTSPNKRLHIGHLYEVRAKQLIVRHRPSTRHKAIAILHHGAMVMMMGEASRSGWARILTTSGMLGFVPTAELSQRVGFGATAPLGW